MEECGKTKNFDPEISLETGKELFQKGDYLAAIESFNKILNVNPADANALFEIGKTYYMLQEYISAIEFLNRAIKLMPDTAVDIAILLSKAYKSAGRYDDSINILTKLKNSGCSNPEIDYELNFAYRGKYSEVIDISKIKENYKLIVEECKKAIENNPYDEENHFYLVQTYNFIGDYKGARENASAALNIISNESVFSRNRLLNELEIADGRTFVSSKIRRLTVTLSNRCNLSCIMCLTHNVPWEIPKETIKEIFSLFPYLEKVMWQGGEVFALDYFDEILACACQFPNLRQSIVTNGQLITEKIADKLVKNNTELTFSVDGVTKDIYEYIRRGANFERLIANIKLISELKKQYKSTIVLNLNVAVMKSNYRQLEGFVDFAKELGFEFVCLMPIHIHLKTPEDIFANQDIEALSFITDISPKIEERAKQYGIRLENRLPRLNEEQGSDFLNKIKNGDNVKDSKKDDFIKLLCHIPWQQLLIDYDGSVRPDCLCRIEKSVGSLLENPSLEDIWNNEAMVEYRKRILAHCYVDFCNSICYSNKIAESHFKIP
jgi:MoaA/NifB/PqqE/SkfB family radical SAM enzyme/Flp pilus assembly protein TadD